MESNWIWFFYFFEQLKASIKKTKTAPLSNKVEETEQTPHRKCGANIKGSPAHSLGVKVARVTPIDDDDLVVFVQETLDGWLGRARDVAPEAGAVAGPPEGVALAVLLSEHEQDLERV